MTLLLPRNLYASVREHIYQSDIFYFDYLGKHFKGLLLDTACKRQSSIIQFSISRPVPQTSCLLRCYTVSEQHYFCQEFQHICFFYMNSAGELFRLRTWQFYCEWRFLSLIEKVLNETGRTSHSSIQRYTLFYKFNSIEYLKDIHHMIDTLITGNLMIYKYGPLKIMITKTKYKK